ESVLARNFPSALSDAQFAAWKNSRLGVLEDPDRGQALSISSALERVAAKLLDSPEHAALLDTQAYLLQRQSYWLGATPPAPNTPPVENAAPSAQSEPDAPPSHLNDQMDLF
ncbi:MAG: hypothetical protein ACI9RY_001614, partial [Reinekea sp.]